MEDAGALDFFTSSIRANPPANHEVMSAYVLLSRYSKAMGKVGVAPGLAARMITGAVYVEPELDAKRHKEKLGLWEKVANVLITLVNGTALDVDKLDYIIRDTWASGVKNTAIDMDRLVRSATIVRSVSRGEDHVCFAFKKSAISVVQSVIDARNYLYKWIYGHHTVLYYSHLLEHAVVNFAEKYAKEYHTTAKSVLQRMFSPEMFEREVFLAKKNGLKSYLLSDADILYFLKMVIPDDPDYVAYVSHKPHHIPLWKTALEYNNCLQSKRFSVTKMDAIRAKHHLSQDECFACEDMTAKIYDLKDEDVQIEMSSGSVVPITKLVALPKHPSLAEKQELSFCYVYLDVSRREDKEEIVKSINKLSAKR